MATIGLSHQEHPMCGPHVLETRLRRASHCIRVALSPILMTPMTPITVAAASGPGANPREAGARDTGLPIVSLRIGLDGDDSCRAVVSGHRVGRCARDRCRVGYLALASLDQDVDEERLGLRDRKVAQVARERGR